VSDFASQEGPVDRDLDGVHKTIADELGSITPTQTLPHQGGGLSSGLGSQPETLLGDEQPS
jgi:hypothetical protein